MEKIKWGSGCVTAEAEPREWLGYFQSTIPLNPDATTLKATGPFRSSCLDWNIYRRGLGSSQTHFPSPLAARPHVMPRS